MENSKTPSQSIKVGYLVSEYPAVSHTFILREIKALRAHGFQVFTASINKPKINFEIEEEKRTFYIKSHGSISCLRCLFKFFFSSPFKLLSSIRRTFSLGMKNRLLYHFFYWAEALLLAEWLEINKISHLHVHFINPSSTVALIASELTQISLSFTVHGPDSFKECAKNLFSEKVATAKFVVCISDYAKSQVMNLTSPKDWAKLNVIRLGVDTDLYSPKIFRKDPERFELLCVGRLTPAKAQHLVIEALDRFREEYDNFHMTFVGGGPDFESLNDLVSEKGLSEYVTFTGPLSEDDTRLRFQESDVFLLPSFAEGLPVVLMEAMSTGLPCITTYVAGIPELVEDGKNGVLVYPGNVEEIVKGLKTLVSNSEKRARLGTTARKKVTEQYSITVNTETLAKYFKEQLQ